MAESAENQNEEGKSVTQNTFSSIQYSGIPYTFQSLTFSLQHWHLQYQQRKEI